MDWDKYNYLVILMRSCGLTWPMLYEISGIPEGLSRRELLSEKYDLLIDKCKDYCAFVEEMQGNTLTDSEWLEKNTMIKYDFRDVDIQRILGISRSKLSNWLNGYTPISTFEKFKIKRTIDYYSFLGFTKMKNEEFKNTLIHYMDLFDCAQEELSKRTSLTQEAISMVRNGKRYLDIEQQYLLLKAIYDMTNSCNIIKDRNREEFDFLGLLLFLDPTYNQPKANELITMEDDLFWELYREYDYFDEECVNINEIHETYEREICELEEYLLTLSSKTQDIFIENLEAFIYDCLDDDGVVIVSDPYTVNDCVIDYRKKTDEEKELFIKEKEKLVSEKYENNYHTTKLFDICTSYRNIIKNVKKYGVLADICDEVISEKQAQKKFRKMEDEIIKLSPSYEETVFIDANRIKQQLSYTLGEWYVAFLSLFLNFNVVNK